MEDKSGRRFYDYIVVGCGGVGSAALYWLSKRAGIDVLGLEQFSLGHDHGGSQDHSRIMWEEVEKESGVQLVYKTGGVNWAKTEEMGYLIDKYAEAMTTHNIKYERLTGSQLNRKFPQFETDDKYSAIYEPMAGLVDAAMGNSVHIQLARAHGATVIENCTVRKLDKTPNGNVTGVFQCRRLVVSAGAWINHVIGSIGVHVPVYVTQEQVTYFATPNVKDFTKERFASLLGRILSEIAIDGRTKYDVSKFNIDREAITNPDWTPTLFMGTGGKVPTKNSSQQQTQAKL
ncbi:hypothetical protein FSP39_015259 [Pinctada imbricata]|uniref:FAD dependent oxidoreductase domain-containing protein n=1 Tax=Pinctada imbricata TaxID=66713 RepID=A0AA88XIC0_PINIB|nr:hypothetical protein FSP39_015259 [Pinctada imbricata]